MDSSGRRSGKESTNAAMDRRQFLKWMGLAGAVAVVGAGAGLRGIAGALSSTASAEVATSGTAAVEVAQGSAATTAGGSVGTTTGAAEGATSSACAVRCPNGCSYPGRCRRYTDSNGNNRCDFGECL